MITSWLFIFSNTISTFSSSRDVNLSTFAQERSALERGLYMLSVSKSTTVDLICVWLVPASPLPVPVSCHACLSESTTQMSLWVWSLFHHPCSCRAALCASAVLVADQSLVPWLSWWAGFPRSMSGAGGAELLRLIIWALAMCIHILLISRFAFLFTVSDVHLKMLIIWYEMHFRSLL